MKTIIKAALLSTAVVFSASANAMVIDFITMADTNSPGERGFATLSVGGGLLNITGHASNDNAGDTQQFAYLDKGNAGLGACKDINGSNQCTPSSDDNVTTGEWLTLTAVSDLLISNLWFNNNHDEGFDALDKISIGSDNWFTGVLKKQGASATGYTDDANYTTDITLLAGQSIKLSFFNEQFYLSALEVEGITVPEPATLGLLGLGALGLFASRRRKAA